MGNIVFSTVLINGYKTDSKFINSKIKFINPDIQMAENYD